MTTEKAPNDPVGLYYRTLTDSESALIYRIKELGQEFIDLIDSLGSSDETKRAKARIEEAVMWSVKHVSS